MVANPLQGASSRVADLFHGWPNGTTLSKFETSVFRLNENTFTDGAWSSPDERLLPGEGAIFYNPTPARPGPHRDGVEFKPRSTWTLLQSATQEPKLSARILHASGLAAVLPVGVERKLDPPLRRCSLYRLPPWHSFSGAAELTSTRNTRATRSPVSGPRRLPGLLTTPRIPASRRVLPTAPIRRWHAEAEHRAAQERGRATWYARFHLRVCRVERAYEFDVSASS